MEISRKKYMDTLINFKDMHIIKVISGIRRCGKSTLLKMYANLLRKLEIQDEQIIFINFENIEYEELKSKKKLYDYIKNKIIKNKMNYIFLDEIQQVFEFEKVVDSLFLYDNVDIYITGSNAYFLSSEISTLLTGRYIEIKMLPLSFSEYASAIYYDNLTSLFYEYIQYGSFPQIIEITKKNKENANLFIDGILNTILYKDVMSRNFINDKLTLEKVLAYLYDNIGNRTSINKIANTIQSNSKNGKNSYNVITNYVQALIDSFLIYKVPRYDIKGKEILKTQEKFYAVDIGIRYHLLGQSSLRDIGHILENVVYLELLRRYEKVYVGKYDEYEIDFIVRNEEGPIYFQVATTTYGDDNNILNRELKPLKKINDNSPKYILTLDNEPTIDYDGIKKINILKWMLEM